MSNRDKFVWNEDDIVVDRQASEEAQNTETVEALLDTESDLDAE